MAKDLLVQVSIEKILRICAKSPCGLEGVAGTLLAFRLLEFELFIFCSRNAFMFSVKISRSVLPVYRNFVPQEKNPPPEITAALWLLGNLKVVSIELNKRVTIS